MLVGSFVRSPIIRITHVQIPKKRKEYSNTYWKLNEKSTPFPCISSKFICFFDLLSLIDNTRSKTSRKIKEFSKYKSHISKGFRKFLQGSWPAQWSLCRYPPYSRFRGCSFLGLYTRRRFYYIFLVSLGKTPSFFIVRKHLLFSFVWARLQDEEIT